MDRKTIIAVMLSMGVILIYTRFMTPQRPVAGKRDVNVLHDKAPEPARTPGEEKIEQKVAAVPGAGKTHLEGELSTIKNDSLDAVFSSRGGCVGEVTLRRSSVIKKGPVDIIVPLSPAIQPVMTSLRGTVDLSPQADYSTVQGREGSNTVIFKQEFGSLTVTKSYLIPGKGFVISSVIEMENVGKGDLLFENGLEIYAGVIAGLTHEEKDRHIGVDLLNDKGKISRIAGGKLARPRSGKEKIRWLAIRNQYFAIVLKPGEGAEEYSAGKLKMEDGLEGVQATIRTGAISLKPHEKRKISLDLYMGPKEYSALEQFGAVGVIDFGKFGFLGKWILKGLNILYALCGNYGLAIILLTVVIRVLLYPLNQKSFRSMKEMQKLQPKIAVIQEKYKADAKKKQEEMMKIYKEHGVNPAGGCLPLLLQFPILIAFFSVLQNAVELWGAPFYLWMRDLSEPDALFSIQTGSTTIPMIGKVLNGRPCVLINVLPILLLIVFYIQQKMTPTGGMASSPEQQQSQKMMNYIMPFMFGIIFYNMPAGLNLYFAASTLLGILQQKYMIK